MNSISIINREFNGKKISQAEEGLFYGKNLVSPNNPRETQPHYYIDNFQELLDRMDSLLPTI